MQPPQIPVAEFHAALAARGVELFAGVPDSLLSPLCAYLAATLDGAHYLITANEGNAIAIAAGYHLATGRPACCFMQNSGLGNAVNPLLSLTDEEVYSIPLLMLVGWRGEPGTSDEPQHTTQGRLTLPLLRTLGIDHQVLDPTRWHSQIDDAMAALRASRPYALVVRRGTFAAFPATAGPNPYSMTREQALEIILDGVGQDFVVSSTGKASREIYEIRKRRGQPHDHDFLTVGSMGHASSIALGIGLGDAAAPVWCVDGDGAFIMHMGAAALLAADAPPGLRYIVINNGAHESVGGQPTLGFDIDLPGVLRDVGFSPVHQARTPEELTAAMAELRTGGGALVVMTKLGARADLGRPEHTPRQNKAAFSAALRARP